MAQTDFPQELIEPIKALANRTRRKPVTSVSTPLERPTTLIMRCQTLGADY